MRNIALLFMALTLINIHHGQAEPAAPQRAGVEGDLGEDLGASTPSISDDPRVQDLHDAVRDGYINYANSLAFNPSERRKYLALLNRLAGKEVAEEGLPLVDAKGNLLSNKIGKAAIRAAEIATEKLLSPPLREQPYFAGSIFKPVHPGMPASGLLTQPALPPPHAATTLLMLRAEPKLVIGQNKGSDASAKPSVDVRAAPVEEKINGVGRLKRAIANIFVFSYSTLRPAEP